MFETSQQFLYPVLEHQKTELLLHLLSAKLKDQQTIVFVRTRDEAHRLVSAINSTTETRLAEAVLLNTKASFLKEILTDFQDGSVNVLVTMDAAARVIQLKGQQSIVNFDFPETIDDYTSRVDSEEDVETGSCITLFTERSRAPLQKLEMSLGHPITKTTADTFLYDSSAPKSKTSAKGAKRKPGKPNQKNKTKRKK